MGIFDRLRRGIETHEDTPSYYDNLEDEDPEDLENAEKPLGKLLERVLTYRDEEIRDLRAATYEAKTEASKLQREMGILRYERDEALQRVAKLLAVLNKKQLAVIQKAPFEYRFGPPVIEMLGYDEKGEYRPITVPAPATMKTVKRKGSHGGSPLGNVAQADRKSFTERD